MTHTVLDPTTNTTTTDPEQVARQLISPARTTVGTTHPEPFIAIIPFEGSPGSEPYWLYLHPAQALAVARHLTAYAEAAQNPQLWDDLVNGRTDLALPDSKPQ